MTTDTSEKGIESLIVRSLIDEAGYAAGASKDFDRDHAVDQAKLFDFLKATQPEAVEALDIDEDGPEGECPEFCVCVPVHGGFKYSHALKRSSNIIANWLRAANHSRTFLPPFSKLRMAR